MIAMSCLSLFGCGPKDGEASKEIKVGTVDVMRVVEERPETRRIKLDWATQAGDMKVRLANVKNKSEFDAVQQEIAAQNEAWQKRMNDFMEDSIELMETEVESLAKDQNIELVVVNNTLTNTVLYSGGEDITTDILVRLQQK